MLVEASDLSNLSPREFIATLFERVVGYEASEDELDSLTNDLASQSYADILRLAKVQPQMHTLLQDTQSAGNPLFVDGLGLVF